MPAKKPIRRTPRTAKKEHVLMTAFDPKTGRTRGGLGAMHVSREEVEQLIGTFQRAGKKVAPELGVRILRWPDKSAHKTQQPRSSGKTVSMQGVSARKWNRIFGKKPKKGNKK